MSSPQEVLAICVNWNGREVLADALDSLLKSRGVQMKIVVVDNASTDGSHSLVPPGIEVARREKNDGYAAAINSVVKSYYADPRTSGATPPTYFLLLNNDVVFEPNSVQRLVEFADRRGPGVFGPRIVRHDRPDHLETAWGDLTWSHVLAHYRGAEKKVGPRWDRDEPVSLLLGSVLLIHRSVFEKIGFFDETFFMYHEEVDFLYRAHLAGINAYFCNNSQVRHRGGHGTRQTPWRRIYWTRRNTVLFLRKHKASLARWLYYLTTLKMSIFYNVLCLRWKRTGVILRGVRDGFAQVHGQGNSLGSQSSRTEDSS